MFIFGLLAATLLAILPPQEVEEGANEFGFPQELVMLHPDEAFLALQALKDLTGIEVAGMDSLKPIPLLWG